MKNSSLWGVGKLDSEFILKTPKWPWGHRFHTEAALRQPDPTSASYQTDSAGLDLSVRSAYKKSIMEHFYPFGLSQVGCGVTGHQQKAINADVIYGWALLDQQSRSSAKMYLLLILRLLFSYPASVCVPVLIAHPHQQASIPARCAGAWLLPNSLPAACCMTFNRLYRTYLHPSAFPRRVWVSAGMFGDLIIAGVHHQLGSSPCSPAYELWSPPKCSQLVSCII